MTVELTQESFDERELQRNFEVIQEKFNTDIFSNFQGSLFIINFRKAITRELIKHNFPFIPTDVIITASSTVGFATFHIEDFDEDNISVSSTGELTIRALIGRFNTTGIVVDS